jgi:hypothetical protein
MKHIAIILILFVMACGEDIKPQASQTELLTAHGWKKTDEDFVISFQKSGLYTSEKESFVITGTWSLEDPFILLTNMKDMTGFEYGDRELEIITLTHVSLVYKRGTIYYTFKPYIN